MNVAAPDEALEVSGSVLLDGALESTNATGLDVKVGGSSVLSLVASGVSPSLIAGHPDNNKHGLAVGATIGGGGSTGAANLVYDNYGTVGGGFGNVAGSNNADATDASAAVVAGGEGNVAAAVYSSIGGGYDNSIASTAWTSTIPGGASNSVTAPFALAAGVRAHALHNGAFVWGDAQDSDISSTNSNQFIVRASGGIWLGENNNVSFPLGSLLATSSGGYLTRLGIWISVSDREKKTDFRDIDKQDLLARVADMPVTTWRYKGDETDARHIGPVAQDFYHAFGVGPDERHVAATDLSGVSLAAIQALYERVVELEDEVRRLRMEAGQATSPLDPPPLLRAPIGRPKPQR